MPVRNSHCSFCGAAFAPTPWPRTCAACGATSWLNPLPVAVCLVPVGDGLLALRRGVGPGTGRLALPGGFIEAGETWQQAAAREVREETGVIVDPAGIRDFRVISAPDDTLLVFGLAAPCDALPPFSPGPEAPERTVLRPGFDPALIAFPLHARVAAEYFAHPPRR
jgi:ADP-ribose pyrophosphatase YjhB (NUDIX family)